MNNAKEIISMRKLMLAFVLALTMAATALAQDKTARAQEVLKQARAAIGDEAKLKALQSLSAAGNSRRMFGETQVESEVEIELLLPDKIKRTENGQFGTRVQALNGDKFWTDFVPAVGMGGGGGFFRQGGGNQSASGAYLQQQQRGDLVRLMLGLLLIAPGSASFEYNYVAEAKSPDGTADVIEVKGPESFTARLFIDQKTHRLLMLSYQGKQMPMMQGGRRGPQGGGQGGDRPQGQPRQERAQPTPEEQERRRQEFEKRRQEREEAFAKLPEVEYRMTFGEYKSVSGLTLPHLMTRSETGKTNEELVITKYKTNPSLKPDKFEKKEKS
jgi:hypothetical protein